MSITLTAAPARPVRRRAATVALWAIQIALAAPFVGGGLAKLVGDPQMVALFAAIGAGEGLRLLVGVLEVAAAIGLLVPRLVRSAALGLVALMAGAVVTNLVVLGQSPALPAAFLLTAAFVAALRGGVRR